MKTLKLKKDVVELLHSNETKNVKGGTGVDFSRAIIDCIIYSLGNSCFGGSCINTCDDCPGGPVGTNKETVCLPKDDIKPRDPNEPVDISLYYSCAC